MQGTSGSAGNPYGFECPDSACNPAALRQHYAKGRGIQSVEAEEGQHIYESPDSIKDYNTISSQYFEVDDEASSQSAPRSSSVLPAGHRI